MFGSLPPEIMMYLQQMGGMGFNMPNMPQAQTQIPQTRFSGPLGQFGLLAQQLSSGQQGVQARKKTPGFPGLLGGSY